MPPPAKRVSLPGHSLRLFGFGEPVRWHRVWPVLVSTVCMLAVDVKGRYFGDNEQWRVEGWCEADVPVVVLIVCGNRVRFGRLGREIVSADLPTVVVPLPGGGQRRERQGYRMRGALHEVFVSAPFRAGQLLICTTGEATSRIALIDCDAVDGAMLDASRSPQYERFVDADENLLLALCRDPAGNDFKLGSDVLATVPAESLILALSTIEEKPHDARQYMTTNMLWCILASFIMHCYRSDFGWYAVRALLQKMLFALQVSRFKLQRLLADPGNQPRLVRFFPELVERFLLNVPPDRVDQWPWRPGSMVHLVLPFEVASDLGYSFEPDQLPEQMVMYGGNWYLGPDAVRASELRGRSNTRLLETLLTEITGLAHRYREDPDDQDNAHSIYWLGQFAIPLTGFLQHKYQPKVMSVRQLDEYLEKFNKNSMRHEDRKNIARALAFGMDSEDQRAAYVEKFRVALAKFGDLGKDRMKQLNAWLVWFLNARN